MIVAIDALLSEQQGDAQVFLTKCRNHLVHASIALVVFGSKTIVHVNTSNTASELLLSDRLEEIAHAKRSCLIGVRLVDAILKTNNQEAISMLNQQNVSGVLHVAARAHIAEVCVAISSEGASAF